MNNYELAEKDYKLGMKYKEIADKYGVTINTVKSWKQRYNWTRDGAEKKISVCTQNEKSMHTKKEVQKREETNLEEKDFEYVDDDGLTDKQRTFCYYYMQSFNAYQSAIKAGYSKYFSKSLSYKLLENIGIKNFLNKLKEQQKTEFLLSQERILNRHSQIAFSDMNDFINSDGTLKENIDGTLIKKITVKSATSGDDTGFKTNNTVSIELEDRKDSLKFLTEYVGLINKNLKELNTKDRTVTIKVVKNGRNNN